ncbi:STAS domain-containing protein [Pseudalkalibacillus hwajinpoensis]|uniref:STAS domain-containing protein n=1 Tax=Guptibacillus hwajinpoensis TaxID=208199 RepID=A0A4U1MB27_9BACL|nr:STAS domain-containing protein [Pseudalkalibacillus hwajinpoensis]TKD67465.1 STAS domain-containing protein [Pseudalkalibacillus hwajinpoensis]
MFDIRKHPLPAFIVDDNLEIIEKSQLATESFSSSTSFLQLVDQDSRTKAKKYLTPLEKEVEIELVLNTIHSPHSLYIVYAKWSKEGVAQIVCVKQDQRIAKLAGSIQKQRERLSETNFDLLDKKEELEVALTRIKKLSSPFLPITSTIGVIPLFGTLEQVLFEVNENELLYSLRNGGYDHVIIDFSGIGEVEESGPQALRSFCNMVSVIGVTPVLCGLKPSHAFNLLDLDFELNQNFDIKGSLKDAIQYYMISPLE